MPTAFVLINTEIGSEADVLKDLKKVEGVEEANAVYGVYDIIARVKADTMDRLKEIVTCVHVHSSNQVHMVLETSGFLGFESLSKKFSPAWTVCFDI
jgi:DNA-binding Lrp family transcriptional regulator